MLPIGTLIRTTRNNYERGEIVGYGAICWPSSANISGDGGIMHPVYLVQIAEGSKYEQSACIVFRADKVEVVI